MASLTRLADVTRKSSPPTWMAHALPLPAPASTSAIDGAARAIASSTNVEDVDDEESSSRERLMTRCSALRELVRSL